MHINAYIKQQSWLEAREQVLHCDPQLVALIDQLPLPDTMPLWQVHYPFGSEIKQGHVLYVPNQQGEMQSVGAVLPDIGNAAPLGLLLDRQCEFYLQVNQRIIPWMLLKPGDWFGLWSFLDPSSTSQFMVRFDWQMTSGARSLFFLPKIQNAQGYQRLNRRYQLTLQPPVHRHDQWGIFKKVIRQCDPDMPWYTTVLLFPSAWQALIKDKAGAELRAYFWEKAWRQTKPWEHSFSSQLLFSSIQELKTLKPSARINHVIKHLFSIAAGFFPGIAPAVDEALAPISALQRVFREEYQLKTTPILLQPSYIHDSVATYYSLQCPTELEFALKNKKTSSMDELYLLQHFFQNYQRVLQATSTHCTDASIDFCHAQAEKESSLRDLDWLQHQQEWQAATLPLQSHFLQGCVRLATV